MPYANMLLYRRYFSSSNEAPKRKQVELNDEEKALIISAQYGDYRDFYP